LIVKFELKGGYLLVVSHGNLDSVEEVRKYVVLLRKQALVNRAKRLLLDERNLKDHQDMMDAYVLSESEEIVTTALQGIRLACISHPANYELNRSYETLFLNRSLMFKAFLNEAEAIEWLMS